MSMDGTQGPLSHAWQSLLACFASRTHTSPTAETAKSRRPQISHPLQLISNSPEYNPCRTALAPYGFYKGRFIIGECTRINGGIFVAIDPYEEIVVDEVHGALLHLYTELMSRLARKGLGATAAKEYQVVTEVIMLVRQKLLYCEQATASLLSLRDTIPGQKISIDIFIHEGIGAARHQVVAAAYLLEKLKDAGILQGGTYIDSFSSITAPNSERLIYTARSGDFIYFEPGAAMRDEPVQRSEIGN
jgi:hypothetical protein